MVFYFLFKETEMLKKEYEIKRYWEVVFRYKSFFLNKYFIEFEELLAFKRIVLIMAFIIQVFIEHLLVVLNTCYCKLP